MGSLPSLYIILFRASCDVIGCRQQTSALSMSCLSLAFQRSPCSPTNPSKNKRKVGIQLYIVPYCRSFFLNKVMSNNCQIGKVHGRFFDPILHQQDPCRTHRSRHGEIFRPGRRSRYYRWPKGLKCLRFQLDAGHWSGTTKRPKVWGNFFVTWKAMSCQNHGIWWCLQLLKWIFIQIYPFTFTPTWNGEFPRATSLRSELRTRTSTKWISSHWLGYISMARKNNVPTSHSFWTQLNPGLCSSRPQLASLATPASLHRRASGSPKLQHSLVLQHFKCQLRRWLALLFQWSLPPTSATATQSWAWNRGLQHSGLVERGIMWVNIWWGARMCMLSISTSLNTSQTLVKTHQGLHLRWLLPGGFGQGCSESAGPNPPLWRYFFWSVGKMKAQLTNES